MSTALNKMDDLVAEVDELTAYLALCNATIMERDTCFACGASVSYGYHGKRVTLQWLHEQGIESASGSQAHSRFCYPHQNEVRRLLETKKSHLIDNYTYNHQPDFDIIPAWAQ